MSDKLEGIWIGEKDLNSDIDYLKQADEKSRIRPDETTPSEDSPEYQSNRRDFLKYMGFGLGAATLAASAGGLGLLVFFAASTFFGAAFLAVTM